MEEAQLEEVEAVVEVEVGWAEIVPVQAQEEIVFAPVAG